MSSNYRVLCLSHDPAIYASELEASSPGVAASLRTELLTDPTSPHLHCDLVVGRYAASLIEVTCYRTTSSSHPCPSAHRDPKTWDATTLALAYCVLICPVSALPNWNGLAQLATRTVRNCWSLPRLTTLRNELAYLFDRPQSSTERTS